MSGYNNNLSKVQQEAWTECRLRAEETGLTEVIVQFKGDDLESRHAFEEQLSAHLAELGEVTGGQFGGATMEVFVSVKTSELVRGLPLIKHVLEEMGISLEIARIDVSDYQAQVMRNYHPQTAEPFDFFAGRRNDRNTR